MLNIEVKYRYNQDGQIEEKIDGLVTNSPDIAVRRLVYRVRLRRKVVENLFKKKDRA